MHDIPESLRARPFSRAQALDAGLTARVVEGKRFVRLHKGVYRHRDCAMTWEDKIEAARLALPATAKTTGSTRLQQLGFSSTPDEPLHFVIEGDLHLVLDGVFLHRTVQMPPHDDAGVTVEAAYVAYCAESRVIDAIKMGSMLLHGEALDGHRLEELLDSQPWRRGCPETRFVLAFLNGDCRSMAEAELVAMLAFAGLPEPEVNRSLELGDVILTPDLSWEIYRRVVEYEGAQHQQDRGQYNADIDRYATYREHNIGYRQITKERMRSPKSVVRQIHDDLVEGGYEGPPPDFTGLWPLLFAALADVVRPRPMRRSA